MSLEDSDKWFHFDNSRTIVTNEKGWRMGRGNVVAREGKLYYEVKILRGVPSEGPVIPPGQETVPQPHIRMGWARREAPLDAPVGFDGYSYGVTDIRFETIHRSRSSKIYNPLPKSKQKKKAPGGMPQVTYVPDDHVREGDVIGLEINLPSLSLHRKVVDGIYNPAVDLGDGFSDSPSEGMDDIIRDRIPVAYKGNFYFEQLEYQSSKPMEAYSDRGPVPKVFPNANHEEPSLRSLPYSSIKIYKNGKLVGTAFENLMAFLPPASAPLAAAGARVGFDDGMLGYLPAVAAFSGGIAQVNFGPDFWCPPEDMRREADITMTGDESTSTHALPGSKRNQLRGIGERYKEQIAEDIVWDIIDEVDFFVQDGGYAFREGQGQSEVGKATPTARGIKELQDDAY
jgi:COMPASS component BRE2